MNGITVFVSEWKHFINSPFKVVAMLLFILAGLYGLHNGADLYHQHKEEISKINEQIKEDTKKFAAYCDEGKPKPGPESSPWVDMNMPFWAVWLGHIYHFKTPSPALVYNIGQAEQYGFYKKIIPRASPYDSDMSEEIANPERLQTGTLDFAFVLLYLLPVLLLILLYNIKGLEAEQGFMPLIEVQTASKNTWLLSRVSFYAVIVFGVILLLFSYGAMLTGVFSTAIQAFGEMVFYTLIYLLLWGVFFLLVLRQGKTIMGNTLKMVGVWLVFTFIIPAAVHQWVSIEKPANMMTDFIDVRDQRGELLEQPDSVYRAQLYALYPEIVNSPVYQDSIKIKEISSRSSWALYNSLNKASIAPIEKEYQERNRLVEATFWVNPVSFFQNRFNAVSQTHFDDYQQFRTQIQNLIDQQIKMMVVDMWQDVKADKEKYLEYNKNLTQ
jgi:ABC-2 type transport system permease protein